MLGICHGVVGNWAPSPYRFWEGNLLRCKDHQLFCCHTKAQLYAKYAIYVDSVFGLKLCLCTRFTHVTSTQPTLQRGGPQQGTVARGRGGTHSVTHHWRPLKSPHAPLWTYLRTGELPLGTRALQRAAALLAL
jgi:hypothetical protein